MNIDLDWALIVAYNAARQAGFALMYAKGYRPKGPDKHKTVICFLRATLDPAFGPKLNRLDRRPGAFDNRSATAYSRHAGDVAIPCAHWNTHQNSPPTLSQTEEHAAAQGSPTC